MELPDWMKQHEELWQEFIGHRDDKKKPMNERAQKMALNKLKRYSAEGCSIVEMLETAILKNWDGIWPVYIYAKKPDQVVSRPAAYKEYVMPTYEKSAPEVREKAIKEAREAMRIVKNN